MEDLNYLCIFWPRVTMEQVMKREFLESSYLGMEYTKAGRAFKHG